jgi:hypothetical protein
MDVDDVVPGVLLVWAVAGLDAVMVFVLEPQPARRVVAHMAAARCDRLSLMKRRLPVNAGITPVRVALNPQR